MSALASPSAQSTFVQYESGAWAHSGESPPQSSSLAHDACQLVGEGSAALLQLDLGCVRGDSGARLTFGGGICFRRGGRLLRVRNVDQTSEREAPGRVPSCHSNQAHAMGAET